MVNGDIDNCDVARYAVVDAITPPRLGLSLKQGVAIGICAISASWKGAKRRWHGQARGRLGCRCASAHNVFATTSERDLSVPVVFLILPMYYRWPTTRH
ncbi:hypothetical protein EX530_12810 [Xanthomonas phaseoli]